MSELKILSSLTSDMLRDADDIPMLDGGIFRYWGASEDSPVPNTRVFAIFNQEPTSDDKAEAVTRAYWSR